MKKRKDGDLTRGAILTIIMSGDTKISDLENKLKLDRPTIYYHLDVLEADGLIKRFKDKKAIGRPVRLTANLNAKQIGDVIKVFEKEIAEQSKTLRKLKALYIKALYIKVLRVRE